MCVQQVLVARPAAERVARAVPIDRAAFGVLAASNLAGAVQKKDKRDPLRVGLWSQLCTGLGGEVRKPLAVRVEGLALFKQ